MPNKALIDHTATQFEKTVIELARGVWGAIGYAASNIYMVEGQKTITIIDTSESTQAAENILAAFRAKCSKPVGRIIYTHSHRDHISGATVFAEGRDIPILASAAFKSDLIAVDQNAIAASKALGRRTQAQFGIGLSSKERVSLGIGPGNRPMEGLGAGHLPPNELIQKDMDIDLDGVRARLIMAPGETADHMVVWLPETRVLVSGDNWYHAFPNLYAIRGTDYRDFAVWARSLDILAGINADVLAPGHTRPVCGADMVREVLTSTRDAILHIMRETSSMMDQGASLDDIEALVKLPPHLSEKPWLGEYYGKVGWSARAFAVGTLGWYDGNPTNLQAISSRTRAEHMAKLAGGIDALRLQAEQTADTQWRLELCDHLIALGENVLRLKVDALIDRAEGEVNATARNSYLWEANRLLKTLEV